jgi:Rps23 Pro-64 3,4-dihydroxylase Tpa1-like proline 4-hydroxylase
MTKMKCKNIVTKKFKMCHFIHNDVRHQEHNPLLHRQLLRQSSEACMYSRLTQALRTEVVEGKVISVKYKLSLCLTN